jgi:hypothetical protein
MERPTYPAEREGTAALPYTEILCPIRTWSMSGITRRSDDLEKLCVGAGCHAGPQWQITERPTYPAAREGTAALPYAEILYP